jgi:hypothetical protein
MKIIDFIVCDDIRRELRNKNTLVGVYFDDLIIQRAPGVDPKIPVSLRLAVFIRLKMEKNDTIFPDKFNFIASCAGNPVIKADGMLQSQEPSLNFALVFNTFIVPPDAKQIDFNIVFLKDEKIEYSLSFEPLKVSFSEAKPG